MNYINRYINIPFREVVLYGGIIVSLLIISFMIIGFLLGVISDIGRIFAFSSTTFVICLYGFAIIFYFPIKILHDLYILKSRIR